MLSQRSNYLPFITKGRLIDNILHNLIWRICISNHLVIKIIFDRYKCVRKKSVEMSTARSAISTNPIKFNPITFPNIFGKTNGSRENIKGVTSRPIDCEFFLLPRKSPSRDHPDWQMQFVFLFNEAAVHAIV